MSPATAPSERLIGRVPVRNLWLLMLYASELARFRGASKAITDRDIDDLPDLIARLLADSVELRLRRNLTRGYRTRQANLTRMRGRIDTLTTETHLLLSRGQVSCCFAELTFDTPRNRLVRSALDQMVRLVRNGELAHRCRSLTLSLARAGVGGPRPSRAELACDQIGRNDSADHFMVALALLAFDLALPMEDSGPTALLSPEREEAWVRRLFEKAVLGFARVELEPLGWSVRGSSPLQWQVSSCSGGIASILPRMVTDIILDRLEPARRVIVDTKFASILARGRFGDDGLRSAYLYQMYAYLRSQEGLDPMWDEADGLLLHPAIGESIHEHLVVQNHRVTFATVDLSRPAVFVRQELRAILCGRE